MKGNYKGSYNREDFCFDVPVSQRTSLLEPLFLSRQKKPFGFAGIANKMRQGLKHLASLRRTPKI